MQASSERNSSSESPPPEPPKKATKGSNSKGGASGTAANNNNNNTNSKRIKTVRACDECRKRKVKCDGVQPCSKCRRSEIACVFAKLPPKRGPPKQYIELLEARLQLVEKALRTIDGPARRILDDALTLDSAKGAVSHDANRTNDDIMDSATVVKEDKESPRISCAAPCSPKLSGDIDRFGINEIGQALYFQDIRARIDRIHDHEDLGMQTPVPRKHSIDPDMMGSPSQQMMDTDSNSGAETSSTPGLPSDVPPSLIKTYFSHVHKYAPMIHKPSFYKQLASKSDPPSPLLLYAMCAVASRWTNEPGSNSNALATSSGSSGGVPPGFFYYQRAFASIDEYSDAPRVSTIQALVLLTKYQEYYRRLGFFHRAGLYLGMAVRMCNDLGLPKIDSAKCRGEEQHVVETKKRTFWMVFIYDLMMSIEQGREPYFSKIECTTEYPLATNEEGPVLEELVTNHNIVIQLAKILSDVFSMSRRVAARQQAQGDERSQNQIIEESSRLFLCNTHLENFLHELPSILSYPPTQDTTSYPAEKQPINDVFVGFLHMTYHLSIILLHRHYVLHPLQASQIELQPYPHRQMCAASASNITNIAETMLENHPLDAFSYATRGVQHTIHCVTLAVTVHREEMRLSQDKGAAEVARQQYMKALTILNCLAAESPAVEFHAHIKEAELSQMYGRLVVDPSSQRQQPSAGSASMFSPAHSSTTSVSSSSTDGTLVSSSAPHNDRVSVSDASSTSSSPVLSSSVDMPRPPRTLKMTKSRRHTLTGPSNAAGSQLMQMAKQGPGQRQPGMPQSMSPNVLAYPMDTSAFSQSALLNSSAVLTDPVRYASMVMQNSGNIPMYNHHQQPLPYPQPQQQQQPPFAQPHSYHRKSRLSHHWSYSQEDLRSLRRAHMNKPISAGNWPPAQTRSNVHAPDVVFPGGSLVGDMSMAAGDGYVYPYQQPNRMSRQLRRQSSMTAMMPSYYAQRQQQQQLMSNAATAPRAVQPPTPTPTQQQTHIQQQQQQQEQQRQTLASHPRRHTISIPGGGPVMHAPASCSMPPTSAIQQQQPFTDPYMTTFEPSTTMNMDMSSNNNNNESSSSSYAVLDFQQSTPDITMSSPPSVDPQSMMMLDPPINDETAMMNELLLGNNDQSLGWSAMMAAGDSTATAAFEQRSETHVM